MLSSTSSSIIENFIRSVVQSHEIATGLKKLTSHEQIIDYAYSKGFSFTKDDWDEFVLLDYNFLSSPEKLLEYQTKYFEKDLISRNINEIKEIDISGNNLIIKNLIKE